MVTDRDVPGGDPYHPWLNPTPPPKWHRPSLLLKPACTPSGQVRKSFRVLCRSSLAVARLLVKGVRDGTPPEDLLPDYMDGGSAGGWLRGGGAGAGSTAFGRGNSMSGGRRRRAGAAAGGSEALPYQALVDRAIESFLKVELLSASVASFIGPGLGHGVRCGCRPCCVVNGE